MILANFAVALVFLFAPLGAVAEELDGVTRDVYDLPTPVAIQGRTHNIDQSLSLNAGYILSDSLNRGFPISASFSFYFRPYVAWEVVSYSYNINGETKLRQDLKDLGLDAATSTIRGYFDFPKSTILTGVTYTPFYGKSLMFNRSLVHNETSLYLGAGSISFSLSGSVPVIAPGIQGRYFLSNSSALRLYLRQYLFKDPVRGLTGITDMGIGFETGLDLFSKNSSNDEDE